MEKLNAQWLTDGLIDFEYKKYVLLSYFKAVKQSFSKIELYPFMADLVMHYNNLLEFKKNKSTLQERFPATLTEVDLKRLKLLYKKIVNDDEMMAEIEQIINFALPLFKDSLDEGKEIYEFVEKNCELSPVGLMPLYTDEGYFFVSQATDKNVGVYRYQVTFFERSNENLRGIHTSYIESMKRSSGESFESMKISLTKRLAELPNPAVFLVNTKFRVPRTPTLVPVVSRLLVRYITSAA